MMKILSAEHILIAHRATDKTMPENTLESMIQMTEKGARYFEIDCHLMKDGNIAVIHDNRLRRTTTGKGLITHKILADLDDVYVVGARSDQRIPMLPEVMEYIAEENLHLMIEVKGKNLDIVQKIDDLICAYKPDLFTIYSYEKEIVKAFVDLKPSYKIRWNMDRLTGKKLSLSKKWGVGINLSRRFVTKSDIEKVTAAGLDLHVFTVNSEKQAKELIDLGVKAIITDTLFMGEINE